MPHTKKSLHRHQPINLQSPSSTPQSSATCMLCARVPAIEQQQHPPGEGPLSESDLAAFVQSGTGGSFCLHHRHDHLVCLHLHLGCCRWHRLQVHHHQDLEQRLQRGQRLGNMDSTCAIHQGPKCKTTLAGRVGRHWTASNAHTPRTHAHTHTHTGRTQATSAENKRLVLLPGANQAQRPGKAHAGTPPQAAIAARVPRQPHEAVGTQQTRARHQQAVAQTYAPRCSHAVFPRE